MIMRENNDLEVWGIGTHIKYQSFFIDGVKHLVTPISVNNMVLVAYVTESYRCLNIANSSKVMKSFEFAKKVKYVKLI